MVLFRAVSARLAKGLIVCSLTMAEADVAETASVGTFAFTPSEVAAALDRNQVALTKVATETSAPTGSGGPLCICCALPRASVRVKFCKCHKSIADTIRRCIANRKEHAGEEDAEVKADRKSVV